MSAPSSPTLCRPQHVDRERLRRLLATDEFAGVRFHEAVVAVHGQSGAPVFSLLALTDECLLLVPLGAGGGATGAGSRQPSSLTTRFSLRDVAAVERCSPAASRLRGVMLHADSELFLLDVAPSIDEQRRVFIATFEPRSRAFFFVHRTFLVEFQRHVLQPEAAEAGDELASLLEELLAELAPQRDMPSRCSLLDELATAALGRHALQSLCFATPAAIASCVDSGAVVHGLPAFLVHELALLADDSGSSSSEDCLEYTLSLLQLLHALLFGGHWVAARRRFFRSVALDTWTLLVTMPPPSTIDKSEAWRRRKEDLVDLQAALATELQLLQEEEDQDEEGRTPIASLLQRAVHDAWLARLLKRVGVALSRAPRELPAAVAMDGSRWSLALWRNSALLRSLLMAGTGSSLPLRLRRRRQDEIDVYLRHPQLAASLASSGVPHLVAAAASIHATLELLQG